MMRVALDKLIKVGLNFIESIRKDFMNNVDTNQVLTKIGGMNLSHMCTKIPIVIAYDACFLTSE